MHYRLFIIFVILAVFIVGLMMFRSAPSADTICDKTYTRSPYSVFPQFSCTSDGQYTDPYPPGPVPNPTPAAEYTPQPNPTPSPSPTPDKCNELEQDLYALYQWMGYLADKKSNPNTPLPHPEDQARVKRLVKAASLNNPTEVQKIINQLINQLKQECGVDLSSASDSCDKYGEEHNKIFHKSNSLTSEYRKNASPPDSIKKWLKRHLLLFQISRLEKRASTLIDKMIAECGVSPQHKQCHDMVIAIRALEREILRIENLLLYPSSPEARSKLEARKAEIQIKVHKLVDERDSNC